MSDLSSPIPNSSCGIGVLTARTIYMVSIKTDDTTKQEILIQWPTGSLLQLDSSGTIQFISTGTSIGCLPLSCMDLTVVAPIVFDATAKTIGLSFGGTTLQYIRGDGTLATLPATPTWSTLSGKPTFSTVATSGAYSDLSGLPSLGTQMSADTGWTANSTVGDKTASLASYSNGLNATMVTALNVVSGGTGTAISAAFDVLVNVVKQLAATRTALIVAKLPNV